MEPSFFLPVEKDVCSTTRESRFRTGDLMSVGICFVTRTAQIKPVSMRTNGLHTALTLSQSSNPIRSHKPSQPIQDEKAVQSRMNCLIIKRAKAGVAAIPALLPAIQYIYRSLKETIQVIK